MAHKTTTWQVWKPEIDEYIQDEDSKVVGKGLARKVFNFTEGVDRLQITDVGFSLLGPMVEVGEMGDAVEDENREGYTSTYVRKNFRKKTVFSKVLMDTDQTGKVEMMARGLPQAVEYSRELNVFGMFRNAFNTGLLWADSKPLVSLTHPRKDGGPSQANTYADGVQRPLTYDNVLRLQDVVINLLSNSGNLISAGRTGQNLVLWTSPKNREAAFQVAGVEGPDKQPDTDENNVNYIRKGERFDVLVLPFVSWQAARQAGDTAVAQTSSSNYWDSMWGLYDVEYIKRYFKVFVQKGYAYYDDEIQKNNEALIKYAYDAYVWGNSGYLGFAASKGDGSTYSG